MSSDEWPDMDNLFEQFIRLQHLATNPPPTSSQAINPLTQNPTSSNPSLIHPPAAQFQSPAIHFPIIDLPTPSEISLDILSQFPNQPQAQQPLLQPNTSSGENVEESVYSSLERSREGVEKEEGRRSSSPIAYDSGDEGLSHRAAVAVTEEEEVDRMDYELEGQSQRKDEIILPESSDPWQQVLERGADNVPAIPAYTQSTATPASSMPANRNHQDQPNSKTFPSSSPIKETLSQSISPAKLLNPPPARLPVNRIPPPLPTIRAIKGLPIYASKGRRRGKIQLLNLFEFAGKRGRGEEGWFCEGFGGWRDGDF